MKELNWVEEVIQMTKHQEIRNPAYIGQKISLIGTITLQREILRSKLYVLKSTCKIYNVLFSFRVEKLNFMKD